MTEPRCRNAANALLPWYLNGSLSRDQENQVRDHVETCDVCSGEIDSLRLTTRENDLRGEPARPGASRPPALSRSARSAYVISAVLAIPALLGLYWIYLGLPSQRPVSSGVIRQGVTLDLGTGPASARDEPPVLVLPAGAGSVVISLVVPETGSGRRTLELSGPDGRVLARHSPTGGPDPIGRYTYAIEAASLRRPGPYEIVVAESGPQGQLREYRYPFRVETAGASR